MQLLKFFREKEPVEIIEDALAKKGIDELYAGFTGGKDSVVVSHFLHDNFPSACKGCIFAKTGIGLKETEDFVKDYCTKMGWNLIIVEPKPEESYRAIVKKYGFPSMSVHSTIMRKLKMIPIRRKMYELEDIGITPALISGVRKRESKRRFINAKKEIHKDHIWYVSPMIHKSDSWMYAYFTQYKLERSPVYQKLHISGDCLCGCFSDKSEAKLLEMFYPELAAIISELEEEIKDDPNIPHEYKTWGNQHGIMEVVKQDTLDSYAEEASCYECSTDRRGNSDEFLKELDTIDDRLNKLK